MFSNLCAFYCLLFLIITSKGDDLGEVFAEGENGEKMQADESQMMGDQASPFGSSFGSSFSYSNPKTFQSEYTINEPVLEKRLMSQMGGSLPIKTTYQTSGGIKSPMKTYQYSYNMPMTGTQSSSNSYSFGTGGDLSGSNSGSRSYSYSYGGGTGGSGGKDGLISFPSGDFESDFKIEGDDINFMDGMKYGGSYTGGVKTIPTGIKTITSGVKTIPTGVKTITSGIKTQQPIGNYEYKTISKPVESLDISCSSEPQAPMNAELRCTKGSCKATCIADFEFPNSETVLYISCVDGEWTIRDSEWETIPSCEPICNPKCMNNGICIKPGVCQCPENFIGPQCENSKVFCIGKPTLPKNAEMSCSSTACTVKCARGNTFPDNTKIVNIVCKDGQWVPSRKELAVIPDCIPVCKPACQNGGRCISYNRCECPGDFRGPQCQYNVQNCAPDDKLNFNGGHRCTGDMSSFSCTLNCPPGINFEFPPAEKYVCEYATGVYVPSNIPLCVSPDGVKIIKGGSRTKTIKTYKSGNQTRSRKVKYENMEYDEEYEDYEIVTRRIRTKKIRRKSALGLKTYEFDDETDYSQVVLTGVYSIYDDVDVDVVHNTPKSAMCVTWNGNKIKTFDGLSYSAPLYCSHTLLQDSVDGSFSVILKACPYNAKQPCPHSLELYLQNRKYTFENQNGVVKLFTPEKQLPIPAQLSGLRVTMVGFNVRIVVEPVQVTLLWDTHKYVSVQTTSSMWNRTSGLCGTLDRNIDNDFTSKTGKVLKLSTTFVDAWRASNLDVDPNCVMEHKEELVTKECETSVKENAGKICRKLLDNPAFGNCIKMFDKDSLIASCMTDYCTCSDTANREKCACEGISVTAKDCIFQGVMMDSSWRDMEICPIKCQSDRIYKACGPSFEPSCGSALEPDVEICNEGCFCPDGKIQFEGKCIDPESCPCALGGKMFKPNSKITKDCNTCACEKGLWKCTDVTCGSRCGAVGDPHYYTFDGKRYDFMGKCSYYLMKADNFSIEAENVACPGTISEAMGFAPSVAIDMPSCTKSVTINLQIEGKKQQIKLKQGKQILVDGLEISKLPKLLYNGNVKIRQPSSLIISVEFSDGVRVWWDGMSRVYIDAPAHYRGKTKGLCGTFNGNLQDDFYTPEGDIESAVEPFADKWRTKESCEFLADSPQVPHPCQLNVENKIQAEKLCAKLKSKIFDDCHWSVDPNEYYDDCLYDICACKGDLNQCMCPILAAYAAECARQGIVIDWRYSVNECAVKCAPGQVYEQCGDACSRTCDDLQEETICKTTCVEGCRCPSGQVLDENNECIPIASCPCSYKSLTFNPGYKEVRPGVKHLELCTCIGAKWKCKEALDGDSEKYPPAANIRNKCRTTENEIFTTCEPVDIITCKNMHLVHESTTPAECRPGCVCKKGYVFDHSEKKCVLPKDCSCHHGGRSYNDGDTIREECNTCLCKSGKWDCTERQCPATCTAWGDSHFQTYDGKEFDFQGVCNYVLSKGSLPGGEGFSVTLQNVLCGSLGVTCSKSVQVSILGPHAETITLSSDSPIPGVKANEVELINIKRGSPKSQKLQVHRAGIFIIVEAPGMGFQIKWDRGTRVYVRLDNKWKGRVQGLCGNYNNDANDDMKTPSGGVETSPALFGHSWKLQDFCAMPTDQIDSCAEHPERKTWSQWKCGVLKSDVFRSCHSEVPVEKYLKRCIFDACACDQGGDCECLCTALAAYAQACAMKGISIKWRTPDLCPMQCDPHCSSYSSCVSPCPEETCDNVLDQGKDQRMCLEDSCFEGCKLKPCPEGYIYKNDTYGECVPKAVCKPICMEINGVTYYEGDIMESSDCHKCTCTRNKKVCQGVPCAPSTPIPIFPPIHDQKVKCLSGWSNWMNQDKYDYEEVKSLKTKSKGMKVNDVEPVPNFLLMKNSVGSAYCAEEFIKNIECRTVGTHITPKATGQDAECSLERGLYCTGPCYDYEVRVLCVCNDTEPTIPAPVTLKPIVAVSTKSPHFTPKPIYTETTTLVSKKCDFTVPHVEYPGDCHKFLHCAPVAGGFEYVEKTCGADMMFNPVSMTCDWPASVKAIKPDCGLLKTTKKPEVIPTKPIYTETTTLVSMKCDSSVPHVEYPGDCHKFLHCAPVAGGFQYVEKTCGADMMFNPVSMTCDWPASVKAIKPDCGVLKTTKKPAVIPTKPIYTETTTIVSKKCDSSIPHVEYPGDCHKFLHCAPVAGGFEYVEKTCGADMMFNPVSMTCDWPASVIAMKPDCGLLKTTKKPQITPIIECEFTVPQVEYPGDCYKYRRCAKTPKGWQYVEETCGPDMMFNPYSKICDHPFLVGLVKPECEIKTITEETQTQVIKEEACPPGYIWHKCAVPCARACDYYGKFLVKSGQCKNTNVCVEGCLEISVALACPEGYLWRDKKGCVQKADCTCMSHLGTLVKPGEIFSESKCEKCQCIDSMYTCQSLDCEDEVEPIIEDTGRYIVRKPTTPSPIVVPIFVSPPEKCDPKNYIPIIDGLTPIPNSSFAASSILGTFFSPQSARFSAKPSAISSGAWQPEVSDTNQFLQIELDKPVPIYGIITKGSPLFNSYVTSFKVLYSHDGNTFHTVDDEKKTPQIFRGSVEPKTQSQVLFKVPIEGKVVRVFPLTWNDDIALKLELIGCANQTTTTTSAPIYVPTTRKPIKTTPIPSPIVPEEIEEPLCDDPMGMENGLLSKDQVKVSSNKPTPTKDKPYNLLKLSSPIAWKPIIDSPNEFVMFDFKGPKNLTGVTTKGGPTGWVTAYNVLYSPDNFIWNLMQGSDGTPKLFLGNFDSNTPKTNYFRKPINAAYLKVAPVKWKNSIEMRVEPLGCFVPYPVDRRKTIEPYSEEEVDIFEEEENEVCGICPGVLKPPQKAGFDLCECTPPEFWNGQECVKRSECPCMVGLQPYNVGTKYEMDDCSECICIMGGVPQCKPQKCPPCKTGLRPVKTASCTCLCEPCPEGTVICQSSGACIDEDKWCDGFEDCADDEISCKVLTPTYETKKTTDISVIKECPTPQCPPGFKVKITDTQTPLRMSPMFQTGGVKTTLKRTYTKTNYNPNQYNNYLPSPEKIQEAPKTECLRFICIPDRPVVPLSQIKEYKCPEPSCPKGYEIIIDTSKFTGPQHCPDYNCEPLPQKDDVCNVTGRTFTTFDGTEYKYDICSHVLARELTNQNWAVVLRKNCSSGNYVCTKELEIKDKLSGFIMVINENLALSVDGYHYTVTQIKHAQKFKNIFTVAKTGDTLIFVSLTNGFWVTFNKIGDVKVGVSSKNMYTVDGLCGYYNENPKDDKRKPNGKLADSTADFGDSWYIEQISKEDCKPHACPINLQQEVWDMCNAVKNDVFDKCSTAVDLEKFVSKCIETACECLRENIDDQTSLTKSVKDLPETKKCKCFVLQNFVTECLAANPTIQLDTWRTIMSCEATCPVPLVHKDCYSRKCEPSCDNLDTDECGFLPGTCFSGCYCPEGTVRKGEQCVPITECRDCICDGFGKSQYVTYDRNNFTFDGNCTYLLTRDLIVKDVHTFQVFVSLGPCESTGLQSTIVPLKQMYQASKVKSGSCTKSMHILYGSHIIHIQRGLDAKSLEVIIDGIKVKSIPFKETWLQISKVEGREIRLLFPESQVEILSMFEDMSFSIRVPSLKYGAKMQGLCGDCNRDPDDDFTPNEKAIASLPDFIKKNPIKEFAYSWQADEPKLDLDEKECVPEEEIESECIPLPPEVDPCLQLLEEELFGKCHMIVDPIMYVSACQQDLCKAGPFQQGACESISAYARECSRNGICLDWRSPKLCPFDCPSYLIYNPCGCAETCETIKNRDNLLKLSSAKMSTKTSPVKSKVTVKDECTLPKVEGCFCPIGKVLRNGKCIPEIQCSPCDNEGHYPGDKWYPDKCTECECGVEGRTMCSKKKCSVDEVICEKGFNAVEVDNKGECCPKFVCVRAPTEPTATCAEPQLPSCGPGQQKKMETDSFGCPRYICECKPTSECPLPKQFKLPLKHGMKVVTDSSGCCPINSLVCDKSTCPPKPKTCTEEFYEIVKVEQTSDDACCEEYKCVPPKNKCIAVINGKKYLKRIGEKWSTADPCVEKICATDTTGQMYEQTMKETCREVCKQGYELQNPDNKCCGKCVQTQCVIGGKAYNPGQTWFEDNDNCTQFMCVAKEHSFIILSTEQQCPDVTDCPIKDRKKEGCCEVCRTILSHTEVELCEPKETIPALTVGMIRQEHPVYGVCVNQKQINNFTECHGKCKSGSKFNPITYAQDKFCDCCTVDISRNINVEMVCENGSRFNIEVKVPSTCKCNPCAGEPRSAAMTGFTKTKTPGVKG